MSFSNVVFCNNFVIELDYYINANHKNGKVLMVTTHFFYNKYLNEFNELKKSNCAVSFLFLPEFAINNSVFNKFLLSKVDEDVSSIFCVGGGSVCDIVKLVATQKMLPYVLVPASCSSGGYALNSCFFYESNKIVKKHCKSSDYIIVDENIVKDSPKRMVASCYGQIVGYYINVLDYAFNKTINNSAISIEKIKEIENIVFKTTLAPAGVLTKTEGVLSLFASLLKLETIMNEFEMLEQSSVENMSLVMANMLKGKLQFGEITLISASVLIDVFYKFFDCSKISSNFFPNIGKRLSKIKTVFNSDDISFIETVNTYKRDNQTYKFMAIKNGMKGVTLKYKQNIANCLTVFKTFYNDHGVFMQKHLNKGVISHSLAIAPDAYLHNNIVSFMRNFGLLDIF